MFGSFGFVLSRNYETGDSTILFSLSQVYWGLPRVSVRAHCFPIQVILLWNRLPASIVLAGNIQLFKKLLRQVDFSYAMLGKD